MRSSALFFVAAFLALAGISSAFDSDITQISCTTYDWTIELTRAEWIGASYAQLYILDDANVNDNPIQHTVTIASSGDIQTWGVPYSFESYIPVDQLPSGATWDVGIALLDSAQNVITSEIRGRQVPDNCDAAGSGTGTGSSSGAASVTFSPTSASSLAKPTSSPSNSISVSGSNASSSTGTALPAQTSSAVIGKHSHLGVYIGAAVGGVVVIILIVIGVFCVLRKKRADENRLSNTPSMEKGLFTSSDPIESVHQLPRNASAFRASTDGAQSNIYSSPPTSPRMHPSPGHQQFNSWHAPV